MASPVLEARKLRNYLNTWAPNQGEAGFWQEQWGRHLVHQPQEPDTWHHR